MMIFNSKTKETKLKWTC